MEISTIGPFLDYFEKVRARTMRVVRLIPRDKLEWRPAEGKFALGDLARHIAVAERYVFAECVGGGRQKYAGCGRELADGYDNVLAFMERMHAESLAIFSRLSDADLQKKCESAGGAPMTTWKWLRSMVEHEIHHRGELYAYLGILGVTVPPLYGLTSEQLKEMAQGKQ
ncbi:MAG: DinB family protein [Terriglobales bacterium]